MKRKTKLKSFFFKMRFLVPKTKYYHFTSVNPSREQYMYWENYALDKGCFVIFTGEQRRSDYIVKGLIVFHRKLSMVDAMKRMPGCNVAMSQDFDAEMRDIVNARTGPCVMLNFHPLENIRMNLMSEFDAETVNTEDSNNE